ncbi:MAG TPA: TIM-barrel domain-containing protein [Kofleriaceae bacterium]|jgi:alpha-glucosidase (family GH31 glycosyl hydrolase)
MRRATFLLGSVVVLAACGGDDGKSFDYAAPHPGSTVVVHIETSPPAITIKRGDEVIWATQSGTQEGSTKHEPPHGFAAVGSRAVEITEMFGSYKFAENKDSEVWRTIDKLANVVITDASATFDIQHDGDKIGTGEITFHDIAAGIDPQADVNPSQVQIVLHTGEERIQIASQCPAADHEHMVGLGGQSFDTDHYGETVPLWVQEDGIEKFLDADDNYASIWYLVGRKHSTHTPMPMLLSSKGYALAVKTNARAIFALGPEAHPGACRYETWDGTIDLSIFLGDKASPQVALNRMLTWIGKPATPPDSIFAPWIDAIYGEANVTRVADKLRADGIPASAIWTEDQRGGMDGALGYAIAENWKVDRATYPNFETVAAHLHSTGFAWLTYYNSFIDDTADVLAEAVAGKYVIQTPDGMPWSFGAVSITGQSKMLDVTNPAAVTWAKGLMMDHRNQGADGWMVDFAEWAPTKDVALKSGEDPLSVHNRYTTEWLKLNNEVLNAPISGRLAPIFFNRSAWIGSQPYEQVVWAGDQQTDFSDGDGLPSVIPIGINLGLAGIPYFGSDVAGYMSQGTVPTTQELFYRWTMFGALQPVMRTHHGRSARQNFQWENDANSEAHFKRWTRFHMQLAAYFKGLVKQFEVDGLPLMRSLALEFPDEDFAWTTIDEYMLGDRILVAPVQIQGATSRTVTLPAGRWFPLFGGAAVMGGEVTVTADTSQIPAFVPEGTILVMYPDGVMTTNPTTDTTVKTTVSVGGDREVWLYGGAQSHRTNNEWSESGGTGEWKWEGRSATAAAPTSAMFKGASVPITTAAGVSTVTVVGDGTLTFDSGGTLTIQRGSSTGTVTVRLR